jgi:hypothetical protein
MPCIENTKLSCYGMIINLHCTFYTNNSRLAIQATCDDGEPFGVLTVNLPDQNLGEREIFVKTWSENEEFSKQVMKTGLFIDTGRRVSTGFVEAQVWKIADNVKLPSFEKR